MLDVVQHRLDCLFVLEVDLQDRRGTRPRPASSDDLPSGRLKGVDHLPAEQAGGPSDKSGVWHDSSRAMLKITTLKGTLSCGLLLD